MPTEIGTRLQLQAQPEMSANGEQYSADCLHLYEAAVKQTRCLLNIAYGDDSRQKLDIFMPANLAAENLPVIIFMHGGGWTNGYKEWSALLAPTITAMPAILVCPSYRLIPAVGFPTPVRDCIAALKWAHSHIDEFGGSPAKLFVAGHSAGGQIAAHIALEQTLLAEQGLTTNIVRGCFCVSATFNRRLVSPRIAPDHVPAGDPQAIQSDSPLALAKTAKVPFLITWGGAEDERLFRTGQEMQEQLQQAQCPVQTHVFPGKGHFDMHLDLGIDGHESIAILAAWMQKTLHA